ncbi:hypothetical protein BpHYR1_047402 [Brachionus plicatilis]|uniref:Uncharacterized protein n=1 Tax=Brachionus plicatilis TaxID=10195 RepID=A0A3M7T604_BRAPC|nr:hypothetical protein BpHYR1_047402 [Brachionus plicatilis]
MQAPNKKKWNNLFGCECKSDIMCKIDVPDYRYLYYLKFIPYNLKKSQQQKKNAKKKTGPTEFSIFRVSPHYVCNNSIAIDLKVVGRTNKISLTSQEYYKLNICLLQTCHLPQETK